MVRALALAYRYGATAPSATTYFGICYTHTRTPHSTVTPGEYILVPVYNRI